MALYEIEKDNSGAPTGNYNLQAGGTLWADSPIGTILAFGGATAPSGWFLCQGQAVSRTTYSELFAIIGTAFGAGDGSTTFNIPDMRESVPKGAGLTGNTVGAHLDSDGLAVGEFLDDRAQRHAHQMTITGGSGSNGVISVVTGARGTDYTTGMVAQYGTGDTIRAGITTEVKSVGVNYIIKAQQVALPADLVSGMTSLIKTKDFTGTTGSDGALWGCFTGINTDYVIGVKIISNAGANASATMMNAYTNPNTQGVLVSNHSGSSSAPIANKSVTIRITYFDISS